MFSVRGTGKEKVKESVTDLKCDERVRVII